MHHLRAVFGPDVFSVITRMWTRLCLDHANRLFGDKYRLVWKHGYTSDLRILLNNMKHLRAVSVNIIYKILIAVTNDGQYPADSGSNLPYVRGIDRNKIHIFMNGILPRPRQSYDFGMSFTLKITQHEGLYMIDSITSREGLHGCIIGSTEFA